MIHYCWSLIRRRSYRGFLGFNILPEVIEQAVSVIGSQFDFAVSCVEKYMRTKDKTPENKSKLFRWLLGKGIAYDLCTEVVNEYWN